jgi:phage-related protein
VWLHGEVRTPPFSLEARVETGVLLCRLQRGETLFMPQCRPMPAIGPRCFELRIGDRDVIWRVVLATLPDAILVLEVFAKKTRQTPAEVVAACRRRLRTYLTDEETP